MAYGKRATSCDPLSNIISYEFRFFIVTTRSKKQTNKQMDVNATEIYNTD